MVGGGKGGRGIVGVRGGLVMGVPVAPRVGTDVMGVDAR